MSTDRGQGIRRGGRRLGSVERALFVTDASAPLNLVMSVRIDAPSLPDVLPRALAALQARHPLLNACIRGGRRTPRFVIADGGPVPVRFVERTTDTTWVTCVEDDLNNVFVPTLAPLMRVTCVRGADTTHELVVAVYHAVVDGPSAANLLHELLGMCATATEYLDVRVPSLRALDLQPPADALLPVRFQGVMGRVRVGAFVGRELPRELACRFRSCASRRPIPAPGRCRVRSTRLSTAETDALVRASRRRRVTIASTITAAMLLGVSRRFYGGRARPMQALQWADLRPHLVPPVAREHLGAYVSIVRVVVEVDGGSDLWSLADEVQSRVSRAVSRGDRFSALVLSALQARATVRLHNARLGTVALSYAAGNAVETVYGPIRVRELHGCVSMNPTGAELAAVAGVFAGELWWDVPYLDSDMEDQTATAICDDVRETLVEAGDDNVG